MIATKTPTHIVFVTLLLVTTSSANAQHRQQRIRSFKDVESIVEAHFKSLKGFQEGDLVTQSMTQKLFRRLEEFGWRVSDHREITEMTLPDSDFLVGTLRTSKGRAFLKKISRQKNAIDRADRMARIPNGKKDIKALVNKVPNGADIIVALAHDKNGIAVSKRFARSKSGKDFDKPTGRLYQVDDLVGRLQISFKTDQSKTVHNFRRPYP